MDYKRLRVAPASRVKLDKIDPDFSRKHKNQASVKDKLEKYTQRLGELQYLLYAEGKRPLLICLQGLDLRQGRHHQPPAGRHEPQGTRVHSSLPDYG